MSSKTEIAIEAPLIESSRCRPRRNTIRCALWTPNITRPSPGGYSCRRGRGQEAELEDERSSSRFRRQLSCLPAYGRRNARVHSDCGTQGASSRDLPAANEGLRGWHQLMHLNYLLAFDGVIASRGGIPLIEQGAIIGAIGCSGGTDSQDEVVSQAGAAVINQRPARNN